MKAMVLAAGLGTRLRPLTDLLPKPMIPLGNRPLVSWILDDLVREGVSEIVVNVHHHPRALEEFLRNEYGARVALHLSFEDEILGTGGGLMRVRERFESERTFLLVNGDTVQTPPFRRLVEARERRDAIAALSLRFPPPDDLFTPVGFQEGTVTGFGGGQGDRVMFSGCHAISPRLFQHLPQAGFSGIVDHGYAKLVETGVETIVGVVDDGLWFDIGTAERYFDAGRAIRARQWSGEAELHGSIRVGNESIAETSAILDGYVVRSTLGADSVVEAAARVEDSVLWRGCRVGSGATVRGSVLAGGVSLPEGAEVANALVCPALTVNGTNRCRRIGQWNVSPIRDSERVVFEVGRA